MLTFSKTKSTGHSQTTTPAAIQKKGHSLASTLQTKLAVGKANDKYEQEADRVADMVISSSPAQAANLHRKCADCQGYEKVQTKRISKAKHHTHAVPDIQKMDSRDEEIQTKAKNGPQTVSADVVSGIEQSKGSGKPMADGTRTFMESRIGADFSNVRIHDNSNAHQLSTKLNAQAFAVGNDVYFNQGKYNPESQSGKHLLAHELTHTVQQGSSLQTRIQKQGKPDLTYEPEKEDYLTYTKGRDAHEHKREGWNEIKKDIEAKPRYKRSMIEEACIKLSPAELMQFILETQMAFMPIARAHLEHYLSGSGKEYDEDANLHYLLKNDERVQKKIAWIIHQTLREGRPYGEPFSLEQGDYDMQDLRYAFGGIDRLDWQFNNDGESLTIWFVDPYDFHPVKPGLYKSMGLGDVIKDDHGRPTPLVRDTNCVHAAATHLLKGDPTSMGAAIFYMRGKATISLDRIPFDKPTPPQKNNWGTKVNMENSEYDAQEGEKFMGNETRLGPAIEFHYK